MQSHSRSRGTAAAEICARVHAVAYCTPSRARRRLRPARRVERRQYCDLTRKINAGDDNALRWIETVDAHCGYELPWSPFSLIPLFGGALSHDYHHSMDFGNFGATVIWDRLCGTELPAFKKLRLKGKLRDGLR